MDAFQKDSISTVSAIGLLGYASADIAHHALGHGAACLASRGQIISLSSVFVDCTQTGSVVDLASPFANLVIGVVALLVSRAMSSAASATRLFLNLVAAFNLMWFAMQLTFSAATRTDDWAWAMREYHVTAMVRAGMVIVGVLGYLATVRVTASQLAPFSQPIARIRTIVNTAWLTAGILACATAALDHHALSAELHHAVPQSLLTASGLLFVPKLAAKARSSTGVSHRVASSVPWVAAAVVVGAASIFLLGPGISIAF